jgi:hypothetical protein
MTTDLKKLLADAHLPERTVPICLRGDLVAEHEELERRLKDAQRRPVDSLEGNGVGEIVDAIEALEARMKNATVTFRLRALPKPAWRDLVAAHPPRKTDEGEPHPEDAIGFNTETFFDAITRACLADPVVDNESWDLMAGEHGRLTDRQLGRLADAAWAVNRGDVDIPFSRAASLARRSTASESK